ncbi:unnamed protein product [marine sediment metagenome]|uniref:Uncharacterized protein n=1 Tax=marine sediment metagenome TaxID=412755 RepID=X1A7U1_9ZZZZ
MPYEKDMTSDNTFDPLDYDKLPDKLFRAHHCGGTTVLVKRKVFEGMGWPYYCNVVAPGKVVIGEDLFFTAKAKKAGFELWCDPEVKCEHARWSPLKAIIDSFVNPPKDETGKAISDIGELGDNQETAK